MTLLMKTGLGKEVEASWQKSLLASVSQSYGDGLNAAFLTS